MNTRNTLMYALIAIMLAMGTYLFIRTPEFVVPQSLDKSLSTDTIGSRAFQSSSRIFTFDQLGLSVQPSPEGSYIFTGAYFDSVGNLVVYGSTPTEAFSRRHLVTDGSLIDEDTLPAVPVEIQSMQNRIFMRSIDSLYILGSGYSVEERSAIAQYHSPIERMMINESGRVSYILSSGKTASANGAIADAWMQADGASVHVDAISDKSRRSAVVLRKAGFDNQQYVLFEDARIGMVYNWGTVHGMVIFTLEYSSDRSQGSIVTDIIVLSADNFESGPIARVRIGREPHYFIKNWVQLSDQSLDVFLLSKDALRVIRANTDSIANEGYLARCFGQ